MSPVPIYLKLNFHILAPLKDQMDPLPHILQNLPIPTTLQHTQLSPLTLTIQQRTQLNLLTQTTPQHIQQSQQIPIIQPHIPQNLLIPTTLPHIQRNLPIQTTQLHIPLDPQIPITPPHIQPIPQQHNLCKYMNKV